MFSQNVDDHKYLADVHVVFTDPGAEVVVASVAAEVLMEIDFYEASARDKSLAKVTVRGFSSTGSTAALDVQGRLKDAYSTCGMFLGMFLNNTLKKIK